MATALIEHAPLVTAAVWAVYRGGSCLWWRLLRVALVVKDRVLVRWSTEVIVVYV